MEDIKIGRASVSHETPFTIGAAAAQIVGGSNDRIGIILGAPVSGTITYSTNPNPVAGLGINIAAGQMPVLLRLADHIAAVPGQWWAIGSGAGLTATIIETLLPGA